MGASLIDNLRGAFGTGVISALLKIERLGLAIDRAFRIWRHHMLRAFKLPLNTDIECEPGQITHVKDWLRNKRDYLIYEVEMTDVEAVEFMLRMGGEAEPCDPPSLNQRTVEDELNEVLGRPA